MSRMIHQAIDPPFLDAKKRPCRFRWRGRWYRVTELLEAWSEAGAWWDGEPELRIWRVMCEGGGVFELGEVVTAAPRWTLLVAYD